MIVGFVILTIGLAVYEIMGLWGKDSKGEIAVLVGLTLMTLALGCVFIADPYRLSVARVLLDLYEGLIKGVGG